MHVIPFKNGLKQVLVISPVASACHCFFSDVVVWFIFCGTLLKCVCIIRNDEKRWLKSRSNYLKGRKLLEDNN